MARDLLKGWLDKLPLAIAVVLAAYGLTFLLSDAVTWSNPEYLVFSVPGSMDTGAGFTWQDLLRAFDPLTFDIGRPRFINFLLTILNVKFRLALYEYFVPPVNLSLMLLVHLALSPALLFVTVRNLCGSRSAALASVCLYLSSVGFLSTSVFFVQPGKILIHPLTFCLLAILSMLQRRNAEAYFTEHPARWVAAIFGMNLVALSIDDTYSVSALAACALFWRLFVPRRFERAHLVRAATASAIYFAPFAVFILFIWQLAPALSEAAGAGRCDYVGFVASQTLTAEVTPFLGILRDLSLTALAATLWLRPFPEGMSPVGLTVSLLQAFVVIAAVLAIAFHGVWTRVHGGPAARARSTALFDALFGLAVFFMAQAALQRFHPQVTGGYYYASMTAIFVSILAGAGIAGLRSRSRPFAYAMIPVLMSFQLVNFADLNRRWEVLHIPLIPYSLAGVRGIYGNVVEDDGLAPSAEQRQRMKTIWNQWKQGVREDLSRQEKWPASQAWFLVEMNALSGFVYRDQRKQCAAGGKPAQP